MFLRGEVGGERVKRWPIFFLGCGGVVMAVDVSVFALAGVFALS